MEILPPGLVLEVLLALNPLDEVKVEVSLKGPTGKVMASTMRGKADVLNQLVNDSADTTWCKAPNNLRM